MEWLAYSVTSGTVVNVQSVARPAINSMTGTAVNVSVVVRHVMNIMNGIFALVKFAERSQ